MTKAQLKDWIKSYPGKAGALVVACLYLVVFFFGRIGDFIPAIVLLMIALGCIFFDEALGLVGRSKTVYRALPVPGGFIAFIGWVLLLFPVGFAVCMMFVRD